MLTVLCACGFVTNPHAPIIDPIEVLGRIASLFVGSAIFAAILLEDAEMNSPCQPWLNLAAPRERLSCRFSRMCRTARGVAAARKLQ